jgi:hypothetical protein
MFLSAWHTDGDSSMPSGAADTIEDTDENGFAGTPISKMCSSVTHTP